MYYVIADINKQQQQRHQLTNINELADVTCAY